MTHKYISVVMFFLMFATFAAVLHSCGASSSDQDLLDSINDRAYRERYVSIVKCKDDLKRCLDGMGKTVDQRSLEEIRLNLGSIYALEMSYDSAKVCLADVMDNTSNDLHRAMADVDMMSVCLVTSQNKDFYNYRSDALERFANIKEERDQMTQRQLRLWNAVNAKYHFVSFNYFRRMGQDDEAKEDLDWFDESMDVITADTLLYSNYLLVKSLSVLNSSHTEEELTLALRQLVHLLYMSHQNGYKYFEILASNALARYIASGGELKPSLGVLITELVNVDACGTESDDGKAESACYADDVAHLLASHALLLAQDYHNLYLTSIVRCTMSNIALLHGNKQVALVHALCALDLVNQHHLEHCNAKEECDLETLTAYSDSVGIYSEEMLWIADPDVVAVPEWMALVREQLSKVYAAMGMRKETAYNRNVYFDILDATRQDLRAEQEEERLVREESLLDVMLVLSIMAAAVAVTLIFLYRRRIRRNYRHDMHTLRQLSDICQLMSTVVADDVDDEEDVEMSIHRLVDDRVRKLFPHMPQSFWTDAKAETGSCRSKIKDAHAVTSRVAGKAMSALDIEMVNVLQVFYRWVKCHVLQTVAQQNRLRQIGAEADSMEYKYRKYKRDYILRATTVSVVNSIPAFLNRALHEIVKLDESECMPKDEAARRTQYLSELIGKINDYNDVLGHWIKMRQGMVSLNLETFALSPLFDMVSGNSLSFERNGVALSVQPTPLSVRGDKTMTLFMINTLLDNARKFTPSGGNVTLSAYADDSMVTVEVTDTGCGLSPDDVDVINSKMVYDSSRIGIAGADSDGVRRNKGYGFGLMNCKAIIEKLRKTNCMFASCRFGVRSQIGQGSSFFFSLPAKPLRMLMLVCAFMLGMVSRAAEVQLDKARAYLDSVYSANVEGRYADALAYADSAMRCLNVYHKLHYPDDTAVMHMRQGKMGELAWWKEGCRSDYQLIISLRNEVAITALALQDYDLYRYNNEAFTKVYTLSSTDPSLESYCKSIMQTNRNKKTILIVVGTFLLGCLVIFLLMHYRHRLLFILNLRQLMRLCSGVLESSENTMLGKLREELSDIVPVESMALMELSSAGQAASSSVLYDGDEADRKALENMMHSVLSQHESVADASGCMRAFPLVIGKGSDGILVGVLAMRFANAYATDDERLMMSMVVQSVAMHVYFSHYRTQEMLSRIELMEDERKRLDMEQRKVYMRNQIVDNSLSTLKHETMYYPSRLKQMLGESEAAGRVLSSPCVKDMRKLLEYYKDVYNLLASCAAAQVEKSLFRRSAMDAEEVASLFRRSLERQGKCHFPPSFRIAADVPHESVMCDRDFMALLVDSMVAVYLSNHGGTCPMDGKSGPRLEMFSADGFVGFALVDRAYSYDEDTLAKLFYIDGLGYDAMVDKVEGVEYMICRQIIREHDNHSSRRGCRVYVENDDSGGSRFVFTLPEV